MLYEEKTIETIPVGPLGLIPLKSCTELGAKVNDYLVDWRRERESEHKSTIAFSGYQRESYIIGASTPRFGTGEAKGTLSESDMLALPMGGRILRVCKRFKIFPQERDLDDDDDIEYLD
jgi:hypothetical protein